MMVAATGRRALGVAIFLATAIGIASMPTSALGQNKVDKVDSDAKDDRAEARAHYDKATTAYALGRYAEAASEFEQAFALKADPALLYNAAQAYRLAGRRDRALELYRNYLRVFGRRAEHASDVEWHIAELEKLGTTSPPPSVERASLTTPTGTLAPSLVTPPPPSASLVSPAAPPPAERPRPIYERWWFWAGAGAIVVGAVVVGVVLANRKATDCGPGVDFCANTGL
jgi:tetratricopeptide (TPR) repeat protein